MLMCTVAYRELARLAREVSGGRGPGDQFPVTPPDTDLCDAEIIGEIQTAERISVESIRLRNGSIIHRHNTRIRQLIDA